MPRIYVADLAAYNAGKLHGTWIDDCADEDTMRDAIAAMLRESPCPNVMIACPDCTNGDDDKPIERTACKTCGGKGKVPSAEEWAIHDSEGFEGIKLGENPDLADVALHARMIDEHDGAWVAYVDHVGEHYATEDGFRDSYQGEHDSAESFAEQLHEDMGTDLGALASYVDWERVARDLELGGDYYFADGGRGVYVFLNH